ncbi:uncharacterized protein TrAFT101_007370 [Trichoderma asperellum]|uniref:uncharacterized protein n=1 Tax=Trichoderma asperellum TaxID=101201 RepID=UPI0033228B1E|nr:hypothetical protein TrAFT101_007370 [Trichoderma asperellum]
MQLSLMRKPTQETCLLQAWGGKTRKVADRGNAKWELANGTEAPVANEPGCQQQTKSPRLARFKHGGALDSAAALLPREGSSPSLSQCDHQHLIEATPSVASSFNPLTHTPHA